MGIKSAVYDGSTSYAKKQEIQLDFDVKTAPASPKYDVVLCNYKAAGEGLNFNAATQEVILDEHWNPGGQSQAYGRIDRIGQTKETTIHTIRVEPSVDTWLHKLQMMKKELIEGYEAQADAFQQAYQALMDGEI
jgi:SNF2 family DNA or RNA helicase